MVKAMRVCLTDAKINARKRSKTRKAAGKFNLTMESMLNLLWVEQKGKCAVSGVELTHESHSPYKFSIDRIESNKGYIISNVQIVSTIINTAKSDLTTSEFHAMVLDVVKHNKLLRKKANKK